MTLSSSSKAGVHSEKEKLVCVDQGGDPTK
jgi:hypothetical protein